MPTETADGYFQRTEADMLRDSTEQTVRAVYQGSIKRRALVVASPDAEKPCGEYSNTSWTYHPRYPISTMAGEASKRQLGPTRPVWPHGINGLYVKRNQTMPLSYRSLPMEELSALYVVAS